MPAFPFEVSFAEVETRLDEFVGAVFSSLESEFLVMPKGEGFVEYVVFQTGYEALKRATAGFASMQAEAVLSAVLQTPISLIVLRTILGFTPSEWAYVASLKTSVKIDQGAARSIDRKIRRSPTKPLSPSPKTQERVAALVTTACDLIGAGTPSVPSEKIHRLDKADTKAGLTGVQSMANISVPYPMLLYERFLGRPFAGHRDSVSDLIGDSLEIRIEESLTQAGISYRKTKRAEKITGFDQTPDFIIPDEFNPLVVIEAKVTEDDGTARDKVTRVQHLADWNERRVRDGLQRYELIACIGGRGFGVRREDMRKLLLATKGKVFTPKNLDRLVSCSLLQGFRTHPKST
jgi:hypothetical protein